MDKNSNRRKLRFSSSSKNMTDSFTKSTFPYSDVLGSYTGTPKFLRDTDTEEDMYPVQDADDL